MGPALRTNLRHRGRVGYRFQAALWLRIAQPALSRQIAALEQELGLRLFDRVGRRLMLTGEGEQMLGDCRALLNYADALGERAQSAPPRGHRRAAGGVFSALHRRRPVGFRAPLCGALSRRGGEVD